MRANVWGRVAAAALLLATALGASPTPAPPEPNGIFDAARKAWGAGAYPRFAEYVAVVSFHNGTRLVRRSWETTEDLRHGVVYSHAFSREERANPTTPHGINISFFGLGASNKEQPVDPIGQIAFAIDQDYGLAPGERQLQSTNTTTTFDAVRSTLPVIGRTGTVARDYAVTLIETAVDEQGPEYHLGLRPLRDPERLRLRELWIDGNTWRTEEAVVDGIGSRPPLTKVQWRIEYRETEGATYIATETALGPLDYGRAGTLRDVKIAFAEVHLQSRPSPFGFGFSTALPQGEP
jgi:hypothetical protein